MNRRIIQYQPTPNPTYRPRGTAESITRRYQESLTAGPKLTGRFPIPSQLNPEFPIPTYPNLSKPPDEGVGGTPPTRSSLHRHLRVRSGTILALVPSFVRTGCPQSLPIARHSLPRKMTGLVVVGGWPCRERG